MTANTQEKESRRIAFVSKFYDKGSVFFLYGDESAKQRIFDNFLAQCGGALCVYAHPKNMALELQGSAVQEVQFGSGGKWDFKGASEALRSAKSKGSVRVLNDFCGELSEESFEEVLGYLNELKKLDVPAINSFDASCMSDKMLRRLLESHEYVVISFAGENSVVFPSRAVLGKASPVDVKFISQKNMEKWIKRSLDILMLAMLEKKPMSGFEIIKTVIRSFGILINQGMVYPLLHSLERRGYLVTGASEDRKTKLYSLTPQGEKFARERVMEYAMAQKMILDTVLQA